MPNLDTHFLSRCRQVLLFWEGRSHFANLALEAELHPTLGVDRFSGDVTTNDHSFMVRHHRFPQMYVHPRVCSPSTGISTCGSSDLTSVPDGTALVFQNMNRRERAILYAIPHRIPQHGAKY